MCLDGCVLRCVLYTQMPWMADWQTQQAHCPGIYDTQYLAKTGPNVSSLTHMVSTAGCVQQLSSVGKQCLLVVDLQIWT